jgi:hypothetical protein
MNKAFIIIILFMLPTVVFATSCNDHFVEQDLLTLKDNDFVISSQAERNQTAIKLLTCLGHPNPKIRDGVVYEASSQWLRKGLLTTQTIKAMFAALTEQLSSQVKDKNNRDADNFRQPFAALVLSEVVRVDRISPYLTIEQRQTVVDVTTHYMQHINDYRGFDDQYGWRHAVAHTADVFLQLALNKNITKSQLTQLLNAIKMQITPSQGHFYVYGEPKRLAMPFVYLTLRTELSEQTLISFLDQVADPTPFKDWTKVYSSNAGLAKLHNTRAFIYSLYAITSKSKNPSLISIQAKLADIMDQLG